MSTIKTKWAIASCFFFFFHGHYNDQKRVSNVHYLANNMLTNGYKGRSITLTGILMSFLLIKKQMGAITLDIFLMANMIIKRLNNMPNIC